MCHKLRHAFVKTLISGSLNEPWVDLGRKKEFESPGNHNLKTVVGIKFCSIAIIKQFFRI